MKIKKIQISNLLGKKDIEWNLNPQVNVLVGKNGVGKSTILLVLRSMLTNALKVNNSLPFDSSSIYFDDENIQPIIYKSSIFPKEIAENPKFREMTDKIDRDFKKAIIEKVMTEIAADKKFDFDTDLQIIEKVVEEKFSNPYLKYKVQQQIFKYFLKDIDNEHKKFIDEFYQIEIADLKNDESIFEKLNISFISMSQLNAFSSFEYKDTNQEMTNLLDSELAKEFYKYEDKNNKNIAIKLIDTINEFLSLVNKKAIIEDNKFVFIDKEINKRLTFSKLSNGEQQLVFLLIQVSRNSKLQEKNSIILMDEPEVSLHLEWQEMLIKQLMLLHPKAQFIIVTHSPAIIMNGWNDIYIDIDEISKPIVEEMNE